MIDSIKAETISSLNNAKESFQENDIKRSVSALPPEHQEAAEKEKIKEALSEIIGTDRANEIKISDIKRKDGEGVEYRVLLDETHYVDVKVNYIEREGCGPANFDLAFGKIQS